MGIKVASSKTAEQRKEEAERLHEGITAQVEELTKTGGWSAFLRVATGFHQFSFSNLLLIWSQCPDAGLSGEFEFLGGEGDGCVAAGFGLGDAGVHAAVDGVGIALIRAHPAPSCDTPNRLAPGTAQAHYRTCVRYLGGPHDADTHGNGVRLDRGPPTGAARLGRSTVHRHRHTNPAP